MAAKKYATVTQVEALAERLETIGANVIDHEDRILNMLKNYMGPEITAPIPPRMPPDEPQPPVPPAPPQSYPWGHHTASRTLAEAVGLLNAARNTDPRRELIIDQIAWEIGSKWPDDVASLPQGTRSLIQTVMARGAPPPA